MPSDIATGRSDAGSRLPGVAAAVAALALLAGHDIAIAAASNQAPPPRPNPIVQPISAQAMAPRPGAEKLASASPFSSAQQAVLLNISNYFNSFRSMEGRFVQIGPRGEQSEGVFVIAKPGKIRFHYKPPVQIDVVSDGRSVAIRDKGARTQDLYPLSKTPLRYLLSDHIDLTSSDVVSEIDEGSDLISLIIKEKSSLLEGRLTLVFDRQSYELRQWIVTDAQGRNTSVAIFDTDTEIRPDPALFKIYISPNATRR